jgi:amino acid transporter
VFTGLVNYRNLNVPDSLAVGIDVTNVRWGSILVKIGALGGLSSTMVVMLLGQSRVFFSMSKDGLLSKVFSKVHPKFRTPWISSLIVGLVVAGFASTVPLAALGEMPSIGTLLAFIIVCAGVWTLTGTAAGTDASIPCSVDARYFNSWYRDLIWHDAFFAARDMDSIICVADRRNGHLFQLQSLS